MSFFINPFKRRRAAEEVELQSSATDNGGLTSSPATAADCVSAASSEQETVHTTLRVKDRASYFESLIGAHQVKRSNTFEATSNLKTQTGDKITTTATSTSSENSEEQQQEPCLDQLLEALRIAEDERAVALAELHRKSLEVESLRGVVRELAESRAAALAARADLAERCCDLHREASRAGRTVDLSIAASRESKEEAAKAKLEAAAALTEAQLAKTEAKAAAIAERRAATENSKLRERLCALERLGVADAPGMRGESPCRREFYQNRIIETY